MCGHICSCDCVCLFKDSFTFMPIRFVWQNKIFLKVTTISEDGLICNVNCNPIQASSFQNLMQTRKYKTCSGSKEHYSHVVEGISFQL